MARFVAHHESSVAGCMHSTTGKTSVAGVGASDCIIAPFSVVGLAMTQGSAEQLSSWEQLFETPHAQRCSRTPALHSDGIARMPQARRARITTRRSMGAV